MFAQFFTVKRVAVVAFVLASGAAHAQSFAISLGDRVLGTLTYEESGGAAKISSTMDNTPLGVFNGSFVAVSRGGVSYESASRSSRKARDIAVDFAGGQATKVVISPENERTDLSDTAKVPSPVVDPVAALGQLIGARGCPRALRFYDGRRAIAIVPVSEAQTGGELICEMAYSVTHGPGHLSPLYIKSVDVRLTYDVSGSQRMTAMQFGAAGFDVRLTRQN